MKVARYEVPGLDQRRGPSRRGRYDCCDPACFDRGRTITSFNTLIPSRWGLSDFAAKRLHIIAQGFSHEQTLSRTRTTTRTRTRTMCLTSGGRGGVFRRFACYSATAPPTLGATFLLRPVFPRTTSDKSRQSLTLVQRFVLANPPANLTYSLPLPRHHL
jgi:hypothetical protein